MKSVVRIVKRGTVESFQSLPPEDVKERKGPNEREIASTIKSWITDWQQRRRMTERTNSDMLTKFAQ